MYWLRIAQAIAFAVAMIVGAVALTTPRADAAVAYAPSQAKPCGTETWHHDGGKTIPFENEMRIQATDGCHHYDIVSTIPSELVDGRASGTASVVIGTANQTWEQGSTIPGPNEVGYCGYAAAQQVHMKYRFYFEVAQGTTVDFKYDCSRPAS